MECRTFEITLLSASNLEASPIFCRLKVYATVSISCEPVHENRTPTDYHGASNPVWNFTTRYNLNEVMVQHFSTMLVVKLFSRRRLACDRYVGEVHTPLKVLFDYATSSGGGNATLTVPVQKGSVVSKGALRFSYRFREKVAIDELLLGRESKREDDDDGMKHVRVSSNEGVRVGGEDDDDDVFYDAE